MAELFSEYKLKDVTLKNRIAVSPMCQYSAVDGVANERHQVHYATLARGGSGLVVVEATGVSPEGRITPGCLGWMSTRRRFRWRLRSASAAARSAIGGQFRIAPIMFASWWRNWPLEVVGCVSAMKQGLAAMAFTGNSPRWATIVASWRPR